MIKLIHSFTIYTVYVQESGPVVTGNVINVDCKLNLRHFLFHGKLDSPVSCPLEELCLLRDPYDLWKFSIIVAPTVGTIFDGLR